MTCKILIAVVLVASFGIVNGTSYANIEKTSVKAVDSPVQLMLVTDKHKYGRNDEILFRAILVNQSLREIFIYGDLEWGHYASLTLSVRDGRGNDVPPNFIADAITHFENPEDTSQFVKLLPFHFLGKIYNTSTRRLNIQRPGKYSVFAEYHSPIPSSKAIVKPFFGKENGIVQSSVLTIEIE